MKKPNFPKNRNIDRFLRDRYGTATVTHHGNGGSPFDSLLSYYSCSYVPYFMYKWNIRKKTVDRTRNAYIARIGIFQPLRTKERRDWNERKND